MGAQRFTNLIRIAEWQARRYGHAAAHARMLRDDRTAVQFDHMAGYFVWRVEQLQLVKQGQRGMPTYREWLATLGALAAAAQHITQFTLF